MAGMQEPTKFIVLFLGALWSLAAGAAERTASVSVAPVMEEALANQVTLIGSAIPRRSTRVSAQVDGMVVAMSVDRGSLVREGDELFRLDDAIARFDLARVRAQLAQADCSRNSGG